MPDFISNTLTHWTGRDKPAADAFEIVLNKPLIC